jgi:quinoprotein glucose dehydrogenase
MSTTRRQRNSRFLLGAFCLAAAAACSSKSAETVVVAASEEGERALSTIRTPKGLQLRLRAAEPLVANPVAFSIDEQGRIYVAETFRQKVEDNRDHPGWLDDDLAAMTVDDRLAYLKRRLGKRLAEYTKGEDRVSLVEFLAQLQ